MPGFKVRINPSTAKRVTREIEDSVNRDMLRRGHKVAAAAKRLAPVDTGRLRASITVSVEKGVMGADRVLVGTNVHYALYQHEGTGIYGRSGRPIRPRKAGGRLVFRPKGSSTLVFAKEVRGTPATKFLTRALETAT